MKTVRSSGEVLIVTITLVSSIADLQEDKNPVVNEIVTQ